MQHFTYTKCANKRHHFLFIISCMLGAKKKPSGCTRGSNGRINETSYCRSFTNCTPPNTM